MPYRDRQKRLDRAKQYREEKISEGYGKNLYAQRKHRFDNEKTLRTHVERAIEKLREKKVRDVNSDTALIILEEALREAPPVKKPKEYDV